MMTGYSAQGAADRTAPHPRASLRSRLHRQLAPEAWHEPGMSPVNRAVTLLIIASISAAVLETEPTLDARLIGWLELLDWFFAAAFTLEYGARLYACAEEPVYRGPFGRVRYLVSGRSLVDLAVLVPFFVTLGSSDLFVLRLVRLLRLLVLARLGHFSAAARLVIDALWERRHELAFSGMLAGAVLLFSATALYVVEGEVQAEHFGSIPRALWWAVATLTTVGYGDVYPITPLGRVIGGLTAIAAIGVIAMPAGIIAAALGDAMRRSHRRHEEGG